MLANIKIPVIKKALYQLYLAYNFIKLYKEAAQYDIINFHHLDANARAYANFSTKYLKNKNHILSFWGSDFYKRDKQNDESLKTLLAKAHTITFTNEKSKEHFIKELNWERDNTFVIQFGLEQLDLIQKNETDKDILKQQLNIPIDKQVLTIGYNASANQQHEAIIDQLEELVKHKNAAEQIHLVIPLTYGATAAYKKQLIMAYSKLPFSYSIYSDYLEDDTITQLRIVSDIMVQLQLTDQFSGSMQEYLFAQNIVITGSWLPYQVFKSEGVYFEEIDKVSSLANKLQEVIKDLPQLKLKTKANPKIIYKISSWESTIDKWAELYEL
jgi:glycosyltransferase involved in cell wall biosynthesis